MNTIKNIFWLIIVIAIITSVYLFTRSAPPKQPDTEIQKKSETTENKNTKKQTNTSSPESPNNEEPANEIGDFCIQVITYATNPDTNECEFFPTPCDVPAGWQTCSPEAETNTSDISETGLLYFYPTDSTTGECQTTQAIHREAMDEYEPEQVDAFMTLIEPLPDNLTNDGYYSAIPANTRLKNIWISQGTATVELTADFANIEDQCQKRLANTQIYKTLTQFDDIDEVIISTETPNTTNE